MQISIIYIYIWLYGDTCGVMVIVVGWLGGWVFILVYLMPNPFLYK